MVVITITPETNIDSPEVEFDKLDYSKMSDLVDGIIFSSYDWARSFSYPSSILRSMF